LSRVSEISACGFLDPFWFSIVEGGPGDIGDELLDDDAQKAQ